MDWPSYIATLAGVLFFAWRWDDYRPGLDCSGCGCPGFAWRWLHPWKWRAERLVRDAWSRGI